MSFLKEITTAGMSETTSALLTGNMGGIMASQQAIWADWASGRLKKYREFFIEAGKQYGVLPAILTAIASRESAGKDIVGDNGHGIGIMQIDNRCHSLYIPRGSDNIYLGANILKTMLQNIHAKHPAWTLAWQWRGAIAAYNMGVGNVQTIDKIDVGTTHGDYSADVWERAKKIEPYLQEENV